MGWDCEWRAEVNITPPSTIQISGHAQTWIIDGLWLRDKRVQQQVAPMIQLFVQNPEICHIFKAKDDLDRLALYSEIPAFSHVNNVLDLDKVAIAVGFKSQSSLSYYTLLTLGYVTILQINSFHSLYCIDVIVSNYVLSNACPFITTLHSFNYLAKSSKKVHKHPAGDSVLFN